MNVSPFIRDLPKAELHLHIEGTFEPELMFRIAMRNGISMPYVGVDELRAAYSFSNLQDFLDIYYQGMNVLRCREDYRDLTGAYLERVAGQAVRHVEIFFDPQGHTERGVAFGTVVDGIWDALEAGRQRYDISFRLIMCFLRHLDEDSAMQTLEQALPFRDRIHGVGLDSSEMGNPPSRFRRVFEQARAAGLRCVAHAGEEGPAAYVREALDLLRVERVDHGNRALEDDELTAELAERGIPLTVCPLSNLALCVVPDLARHPLPSMLARGLKVTLNSDDPAFFGGYINENYQAMQDACGTTDSELADIARNSFEASWMDDPRRAQLIAELDAYVAGRL